MGNLRERERKIENEKSQAGSIETKERTVDRAEREKRRRCNHRHSRRDHITHPFPRALLLARRRMSAILRTSPRTAARRWRRLPSCTASTLLRWKRRCWKLSVSFAAKPSASPTISALPLVRWKCVSGSHCVQRTRYYCVRYSAITSTVSPPPITPINFISSPFLRHHLLRPSLPPTNPIHRISSPSLRHYSL